MHDGPGSLIAIRGVRAAGRHGANPGERDDAQEFLIDLEVRLERPEADSLEGTLDYRTIVQAARRTVEAASFVLLESLAEGVARAILDLGRVLRVTAVVHKPGAALTMGVDDLSAEASVARGE
jgi:dihydroneopterin aldolase